MKLGWILLLASMLISPAFGRLGETREELIKRYGEPTLSDGDGLDFVFEGYDIGVFLNEMGVADSIGYRKAGAEVTALPDAEIEALLKANAGGEVFEEVRPAVYSREWKVKSGKRRAFYNAAKGVLMVTTPERLKRQEQQANSKAANPR